MKFNSDTALDFICDHWLPRRLIPAFAVVGISLSLYLVFAVVPDEKVMGAVQRVFYFHVGSALAAYLAIAVLFICSVSYLSLRTDVWDAVSRAAASVAFVFCTIVLASGMIWGHSAWNVWWRWEPRLVSFLVLWLILLSYAVLRGFTEQHSRQKNFAAVLGILSAVNVPIVIYSVKLLDHTQQLHPEVVAKQGLRDASYKYTFAAAVLSLLFFSAWLIIVKLGNILLREKIDKAVLQRSLKK